MFELMHVFCFRPKKDADDEDHEKASDGDGCTSDHEHLEDCEPLTPNTPDNPLVNLSVVVVTWNCKVQSSNFLRQVLVLSSVQHQGP